MTDLALTTLTTVAQRIQARDLSPVELTRYLLDRITRLDPRFHSYVTVLGEQAMAQARAAEAEIVRGAIEDRCMGYRWPSRICVSPQIFPRPVERRCSATGDPIMMAPW